RQARPRSGLCDAAYDHAARRGRGHPAISNPSTWRQKNRLRRSASELAFGGRLHVQVHSEDRRWPQADGMRRQWYLSTWRIAPFRRVWQARHPPRYAAFNQPSSPRFRLSSDLDHKQLKGAYRSREGIMYRFATTLFAGIVAAVLVSSVSFMPTPARAANL